MSWQVATWGMEEVPNVLGISVGLVGHWTVQRDSGRRVKIKMDVRSAQGMLRVDARAPPAGASPGAKRLRFCLLRIGPRAVGRGPGGPWEVPGAENPRFGAYRHSEFQTVGARGHVDIRSWRESPRLRRRCDRRHGRLRLGRRSGGDRADCAAVEGAAERRSLRRPQVSL